MQNRTNNIIYSTVVATTQVVMRNRPPVGTLAANRTVHQTAAGKGPHVRMPMPGLKFSKAILHGHDLTITNPVYAKAITIADAPHDYEEKIRRVKHMEKLAPETICGNNEFLSTGIIYAAIGSGAKSLDPLGRTKYLPTGAKDVNVELRRATDDAGKFGAFIKGFFCISLTGVFFFSY